PEYIAYDLTSAVRRRVRARQPPRWRTAVAALRCVICEASPRYAVCRHPAIAPAHPAKAQVRPQAAPKRSSTTRKANPAAVSRVPSPPRTSVAFGECPPVCRSSLPPVHFPVRWTVLPCLPHASCCGRSERRHRLGYTPRRFPACLFGFGFPARVAVRLKLVQIKCKKSPSKKNCRIVASAPHPGALSGGHCFSRLSISI